MPITITTDDLDFVRQQTNGAVGWDDDQLTLLAQAWLLHDENGALLTIPDLWAAAALVLEHRLLKLIDSPSIGSSDFRTGDATYKFLGPDHSHQLLRAYIKRYWQRADQLNRALMYPTGWRTVGVALSERLRMVGSLLFDSQVINK